MKGFLGVEIINEENKYPDIDFYEDFDYGHLNEYTAFTSTLKHRLKSYRVEGYVKTVQEEPNIKRIEFKLYLCGFIKRAIRGTDVQLPDWVHKYDNIKLRKLLIHRGLSTHIKVSGDFSWWNESIENAFEEFLEYNILETEIDDIA